MPRVVVPALLGLGAVGGLIAWRIWQPTSDQLLDRGLELVRQDPAAAERLLRRVIANGGHDPNAGIAICRLLVRRKAWQEAAALFDTIDPAACRADLLLAFGRDSVKSNLRPRGLVALEDVSRRDGREAVASLELLVADHNEWGQREKLIAAATRLTVLQPENPKHWALLIEHLGSLGRETECIDAAREALRHEPPQDFRRSFQHALVQQLVNVGDAPAARLWLSELRRLEGDSIRVRGLEIYILRLEGRSKEALELATAIVGEAPDLTFAHFTRGVVCLDNGRFEDAVAELERTIAAEPFNAPARFKLSEAYRALGADDSAADQRRTAAGIVDRQKQISALLKTREEDPRNPSVYRELEQLHRELGDVEAARMWHQWEVRVTPAD
jgi:tetratricopeptide (TPR) repeat protein